MKYIELKSYAKINLSIDVQGLRTDGYHDVEMVMQQVDLYDSVKIWWYPYGETSRDKGSKDYVIELDTNKYYLPTDQRNLAYKAAQLMAEKFKDTVGPGKIRISIKKMIPVAAGLAGGSGNGAAVLHGLNKLWELKLSVSQLCEIGKELGSDVPFSIMGQAKTNRNLEQAMNKDRMATSCGIATGTGTEIEPCKGLDSYLILVKPPLSVSTKEVYKGIDRCTIERRPNKEGLIMGLKSRNYDIIYDNMENVLEAYTLTTYPRVKEIKREIIEGTCAKKVLMSGSGPTIFALFKTRGQAIEACKAMRGKGLEAFWARTTK